jgi:hypothetical protein
MVVNEASEFCVTETLVTGRPQPTVIATSESTTQEVTTKRAAIRLPSTLE